MREVDLAAIVDTAVDIVRPAALAKRLRLDAASRRPALTLGDPDRLQQVIWNLLSNAVKFTPPDGQVNVRLARKSGLVLTVQDSGSGIEPKFLPHVFDAFRQADGSATRARWPGPGPGHRPSARRGARRNDRGTQRRKGPWSGIRSLPPVRDRVAPA